jgi:hypothetical protein
MPDRTERPPTVREVRAALALAEQALSLLLTVVITASASLAELVGNGTLVASCAEARRDVRNAITPARRRGVSVQAAASSIRRARPSASVGGRCASEVGGRAAERVVYSS